MDIVSLVVDVGSLGWACDMLQFGRGRWRPGRCFQLFFSSTSEWNGRPLARAGGDQDVVSNLFLQRLGMEWPSFGRNRRRPGSCFQLFFLPQLELERPASGRNADWNSPAPAGAGATKMLLQCDSGSTDCSHACLRRIILKDHVVDGMCHLAP